MLEITSSSCSISQKLPSNLAHSSKSQWKAAQKRGWEESEPFQNFFEVLDFTISLLFPEVPLLCFSPNSIPAQRIKEPWVQLCIVVCPHWETKPMMCEKPQYEQENVVCVVAGSCWDKIWLEVITGLGVPSLHPCHPCWDPAVSLSSCVLYSLGCLIVKVLPVCN